MLADKAKKMAVALLIAIISASRLAHAAGTETTIDVGTWSGVETCIYGVMRVEVTVRGTTNGSQVDYKFWDKKYTYSSPKLADRSGTLRRTKDRPYDIVYEVRVKNRGTQKLIIFDEPTSKYMWAVGGLIPRAKCGSAYLVPDEADLFPKYSKHRDFCERMTSWVSDVDRARGTIRAFVQRTGINGYDQEKALWGHQFSEAVFTSRFGRSIRTFSNQELDRLIYKIRDCARFSEVASYTLKRVGWFFDKNTISRWASMFPFRTYARTDAQLGFNERFRDGYFRERQERLRAIQAASTSRNEIDGALERIFTLPESPELRAEMQAFSRMLTAKLVYQDIPYAEEVMSLYAAKLEMLRASEALAARFRLSNYPKLPAPDERSANVQVDDEVLKPLTDAEIEELEKPVLGEL